MTENKTNAINLDVLSIINESRMTYGLRHDDYERYRQYCANRVRRIRQILKLTSNSKSGHVRKPLPEEFTDERYLQLYVFETERAWAYAMELKQEAANSMETRQRHHLVKRLKRASQYSETLFSLCEKQNVTERALLDAKAYASLMKGYLYFEQQHWKEALDEFVQSRAIYDTFAQVNSTAEQEALCYAAIDQIDPNIRFTSYKLQLTEPLERLVETPESLKPRLLKLGSAKAKPATIQWRGRTVEVKSSGLADAIQRASWTEAEKALKKVMKEDKMATAKVTSSKSAQATDDLHYIQTYIGYQILRDTLERHQASLKDISRPQASVKVYDEILKAIETLWDLPQVRENMSLDGELGVLTAYERGCRCVQVGLTYHEMKKTEEAIALYGRAQTYVAQARQGLSQIRQFEPEALKVSEDELNQLEQSIRAGSWKSRAAWYLQQGLETPLEEVEVEGGVLLNHLETYPSTISDLVEFPPSFQPVASKPFYFDLAANFIQYPEDGLASRTTKQATGFWGIFGRK